ncbi:hypothetical protein FOCC_FOCC014910 [Frankliniella occidentalis]|uniref:Uncharacterized protein LOC113209256 n=1 Tax=Frankliniella occidentalis TaxID=133901 RepID=A0A9C6X650_FRAOC|nr:uncharacterized protein LOC113209256 [Frankliniella occidentalis]KAE8739594.1 hypothetical protein FOCC_FOCC014910 [Frankliniella occidentalis]
MPSKLELPRVQDGCCCCSLESCSYVQGYFVLLYNVAAAILSILGAYQAAARSSEREESRDWAVIVYSAMASFSILAAFSTVAFLRGIFKKQPGLLVYYIKSLGVHLLLTAFTMVWAFSDPSPRFPLLIHDFLKLIFFSYLLVCANSLYKEMLDHHTSVTNSELEAECHRTPTAPSGPPPPYGKA